MNNQEKSIELTNLFPELTGDRREKLCATFSHAIEFGRNDSRPIEQQVSQQKAGATVIFYNEDKTKTVTFDFIEENGEWNIQVKFEPELKMKESNNELYQNLASQFIDIIKG